MLIATSLDAVRKVLRATSAQVTLAKLQKLIPERGV